MSKKKKKKFSLQIVGSSFKRYNFRCQKFPWPTTGTFEWFKIRRSSNRKCEHLDGRKLSPDNPMTNRFFFLNFRALWGRRRLAAGENSRKKKNVRSSCSVKIVTVKSKCMENGFVNLGTGKRKARRSNGHLPRENDETWAFQRTDNLQIYSERAFSRVGNVRFRKKFDSLGRYSGENHELLGCGNDCERK